MKEIILKSLVERKNKRAKKTKSICFDKEIADEITSIATEIECSESFLVNEILRKVLL